MIKAWRERTEEEAGRPDGQRRGGSERQMGNNPGPTRTVDRGTKGGRGG